MLTIKSNLRGDFSFEPIGQGCFYHGKLELNRNDSSHKFNFVYDCGTNSRFELLSERIYDYKKKLISNQIDLLIISHFDSDHVNGVFKLLQGVKCKRLVIPYYDFYERLLILTYSADTSENYNLMLQNPINYFTNGNFDIEEIVLIGGPDNNNSRFLNIPDEPTPNFDFEQKILYDDFQAKITYENSIERERTIDEINYSEDRNTNFSKTKFMSKPYFISINFWKFIFYLKRHNETVLINKFKSDVDELLNNYGITKSELFDPEYIEQLKKVYRKNFGSNLNNTSLVTYHGSFFDNSNPFHLYFPAPHFSHLFRSSSVGTLLTGDINIKSNRSSLKILNYFKNFINKIQIFQVPHHGAKANWNFNSPNGFENFKYYVINHGLGRKHHPSPDVVEHIKMNCPSGEIHLNNEAYSFQYSFIHPIPE